MTATYRWPDGGLRRPGSVLVRPLTARDALLLDRIGSESGTELHERGTSFGRRSMPPDRLSLGRRAYRVDVTSPLVAGGRVLLETAEVLPWFGQPGGARLHRFLDAAGTPLTVLELRAYGVLVDAPLSDAPPAAAPPPDPSAPGAPPAGPRTPGSRPGSAGGR